MEIEKIEGLPPEFAQRIAPLCAGNEWLRMAEDIKRGIAELFSINAGESVAVTRFDTDICELVVLAYEGRNVMDFARVMVAAGKNNGARTIKYHTRRRGMARLLSQLGAVEVETVYVVNLE